jgi:L-lactate dehydrogenase complex protein LldF
VGSELQPVLRCIRCGACMNHCPVYCTIGGHAYASVYPGPIGAVLSPALAGVPEAGHLAQASTFCGRCEEVCPVEIPLVSLMRKWREDVLAQPSSWRARAMLRGWALLARRPPLYRLAARIAAGSLALLARAHGRLVLAAVRAALDARPRFSRAAGSHISGSVARRKRGPQP